MRFGYSRSRLGFLTAGVLAVIRADSARAAASRIAGKGLRDHEEETCMGGPPDGRFTSGLASGFGAWLSAIMALRWSAANSLREEVTTGRTDTGRPTPPARPGRARRASVARR